jgi:hypothetical protein
MIRQRDAVLFLLSIPSLICLPGLARIVYGQRPAGAPWPTAGVALVVTTREVTFGRRRSDMRAAVVQRAVSTARVQASERQPLWPWFALGGAVVGGAGAAVLGVTQCDAGCQDDGSLSRLPAYAAVGALAGGVVGAIVGLLVDTSISDNHSRPTILPNESARRDSRS